MMLKLRMLPRGFAALAIICFAAVSVLNGAPDPYPLADPAYEGDTLILNPKVEYEILVLKVSAHDGSVYYKEFDSGNTPYFRVGEAGDGEYTYQLYMIPRKEPLKREGFDDKVGNGRGPDPYGPAQQQSGSFSVQYGKIVFPQGPEEGDKDPGKSAPQDFVINDDLIVDGSACIGFDCVNGEDFGYDTIRLREHNLRIKFDDTSTSSSFPRNDWQITINSKDNGGGSYFRVDDITAGRSPFTIEANARSHSLYVDDGGRLGLRTSTPAVEIHAVDSDTPTLRLQQDGSAGFAPQTWDVAGNETNFFIRDVTGGSSLPFLIRPGAPSRSLFINGDGAVGIGTSSPDYRLEVFSSEENAQVVANRSDGATGILSATDSYAFIGALSNHSLRFTANNTWRMQINLNQPYLEMADGGDYDGTWNDASSREFKENIQDLGGDEAMSAFSALTPVTYNYKTKTDDQRVGFIAEDVPELVARNGRKNLSSMEIVAVLTRVMQQQQDTLQQQKKIIEEQRRKMEELNQRLEKLEKK